MDAGEDSSFRAPARRGLVRPHVGGFSINSVTETPSAPRQPISIPAATASAHDSSTFSLNSPLSTTLDSFHITSPLAGNHRPDLQGFDDSIALSPIHPAIHVRPQLHSPTFRQPLPKKPKISTHASTAVLNDDCQQITHSISSPVTANEISVPALRATILSYLSLDPETALPLVALLISLRAATLADILLGALVHQRAGQPTQALSLLSQFALPLTPARVAIMTAQYWALRRKYGPHVVCTSSPHASAAAFARREGLAVGADPDDIPAVRTAHGPAPFVFLSPADMLYIQVFAAKCHLSAGHPDEAVAVLGGNNLAHAEPAALPEARHARLAILRMRVAGAAHVPAVQRSYPDDADSGDVEVCACAELGFEGLYTQHAPLVTTRFPQDALRHAEVALTLGLSCFSELYAQPGMPFPTNISSLLALAAHTRAQALEKQGNRDRAVYYWAKAAQCDVACLEAVRVLADARMVPTARLLSLLPCAAAEALSAEDLAPHHTTVGEGTPAIREVQLGHAVVQDSALDSAPGGAGAVRESGGNMAQLGWLSGVSRLVALGHVRAQVVEEEDAHAADADSDNIASSHAQVSAATAPVGTLISLLQALPVRTMVLPAPVPNGVGRVCNNGIADSQAAVAAVVTTLAYSHYSAAAMYVLSSLRAQQSPALMASPALCGLFAALLSGKGQAAELHSLCTHMVQAHTRSHHTWLACAAYYMLCDSPVQAHNYLARAHALAPTSPHVWRLLGHFCSSQADSPKALDAYRVAAAVAPGDPHLPVYLAMELVHSGRVADAVKQLHRALRAAGCVCKLESATSLCVCDCDGYVRHCLRHNGDGVVEDTSTLVYILADTRVKDAFAQELDAQQSHVLTSASSALRVNALPRAGTGSVGHHSASASPLPLSALSTQARGLGGDALVYLELGTALYHMGEYTCAVSWLRRALYLCQRPLPALTALHGQQFEHDIDLRVRLHLAHALRRCGLFAHALMLYRSVSGAVTEEEDLASVYCGMGMCMHIAGDPINAIENYQRALCVQPSHLVTKTLIAKAVAQTVTLPVADQ